MTAPKGPPKPRKAEKPDTTKYSPVGVTEPHNNLYSNARQIHTEGASIVPRVEGPESYKTLLESINSIKIKVPVNGSSSFDFSLETRLDMKRTERYRHHEFQRMELPKRFSIDDERYILYQHKQTLELRYFEKSETVPKGYERLSTLKQPLFPLKKEKSASHTSQASEDSAQPVR